VVVVDLPNFCGGCDYNVLGPYHDQDETSSYLEIFTTSIGVLGVVSGFAHASGEDFER